MKNNLKYILLAPAMGLTLAACQDTWDDHYGQQPDTTYGSISLYETMKLQPELSDFCQVLDATRQFANSKMTKTTYKDLLSGDQVFTVWAPTNGTFKLDSLLQMCKTQEGDSLVEAQFLKNHIARYSHPDNGKASSITMLNDKYQTMEAGKMNSSILMVTEKSNLATRNGVLHTLQRPMDFEYNIYEKLLFLPQYQQIGKFFKSYHQDKFNASSSLASGVVDGKTVYIDSVFNTYNPLWSYFDYIHKEDSSFYMLVPTQELWDSIYADTKQYFDCSHLEKGDSISEFYTYYAGLYDALYNAKAWRQKAFQDSALSIHWYRAIPPEIQYSVYYKPFEPGGIFNLPGTVVDTCSNGNIYLVNQWPFTKEMTYHLPIKVEAEEGEYSHSYLYDYGGNPKKTKELTKKTVNITVDSISNGYIVLTPASAQDKYFVEYEIPGVLSGTYDIYVVILPKSVDKNSDMTLAKNTRPNRFTVELSYKGRNGEDCYLDCKSRGVIDESDSSNFGEDDDEDYFFECNQDPNKSSRHFSNDPLVVDTIKICTFKFPTCNAGETKINTHLKISNAIEAKTVRSSNEIMFLDCIILEPHSEK